MKIMNKKQFAQTPNGTVYCLFKPSYLYDEICIKTGYFLSGGSPTFNGIIHLFPMPVSADAPDYGYDDKPSSTTEYETDHASVDTTLDDYDDHQLFAVFSKNEVQRMIDVLTWALSGV